MFNQKSLSEKCKEAYDKLDSSLKEYWANINQTNNWGCVTYLYKKYGCPETLEDFYNLYCCDSDGENPKEHGRSEDYIYQWAEMLSEYVNADVQTVYNYILYKLFYVTIKGCKKELLAKELLESKGYTALTPSLEDDAQLGIDLKVYSGETHLFNLQVKPDTFFKSNTNQGLIRDRKIALKKDLRAKQRYNVETYYLIYSNATGGFICNQKGKHLFKLSRLINENGLVN